LFTKRSDDRGVRAFDDLAAGLETGAISRGKAIKLGGAALVGSALGLFASRADAQTPATDESIEVAVSRRKCKQRGGDFCRNRAAGPTCKICCGRDRDGGGRRRRKACCGQEGCNCCRRNQRCTRQGTCT